MVLTLLDVTAGRWSCRTAIGMLTLLFALGSLLKLLDQKAIDLRKKFPELDQPKVTVH